MIDNKNSNNMDNKNAFDLGGICTEPSWGWMIALLMLLSMTPMVKMETLEDMKKSVAAFNEYIQAMEDLPEVERHED